MSGHETECTTSPCTCEHPRGAEVVVTGLPNVQLLACVLCGVLLWDIDAHYAHAHTDQSDGDS